MVLFRYSRLGREWRAYADDPLAAEMMGVSPAATTARAFALSGALAGLAGAIMTAAFGAVGYGLSATLTLKALTAAIIGGIGSLPGAFLGGLIVGAAETGWSALLPDRLSRRRGLSRCSRSSSRCAPPACSARARPSRTTYSRVGLDLASASPTSLAALG